MLSKGIYHWSGKMVNSGMAKSQVHSQKDCSAKISRLAAFSASSKKQVRKPSTDIHEPPKSVAAPRKLDAGQREFIEYLRKTSKAMKDPSYMEGVQKRLEQFANSAVPVVAGSQYGTQSRAVNSQMFGQGTGQDSVSQLLDDIADTSAGKLGGVGALVNSGTMDVARGLASGRT